MKRILLPFILLLLSLTECQAQQTMREVFKAMPDSLLPYLTENNKLDFLDFIDSNMTAEVTNKLGGKSKMETLSDDYTCLVLNESSTMEMRLLDTMQPVDSISKVVCVIRTFGTDKKESTVTFYSVKWNRLDTAEYVSLPDGIWTAKFDPDEKTAIIIQPMVWLEAPADEEQKETTKPSIKVNMTEQNLKQG